MFVGCNDDKMVQNHAEQDIVKKENIKGANYELADGMEVYQLLYTNFVTPNDVTLSPDTCTVTVNSALLAKMGVTLKAGNVISVWASRNTLPFMRRVKDVKLTGDTYTLQTEYIGIEDVLKNSSLVFDSKLYVNDGVESRCADGTINSERYQSAEDGVIHPSAVFYYTREQSAMLRNDDAATSQMSRAAAPSMEFDPEQVVIVDELDASRVAFDLGIDISEKLEPIKYSIVNKGDTIGSIGFQELNVNFKGGLHTRLDISWFKVKKFEIGPYYSLEGSISPELEFHCDFIKDEFTDDILELKGFTNVFWVGPVPVSISFVPSLVWGAEFKGTVTGRIGAEINFSGNHHDYAVYERGKGWRSDEGGDPFKIKVEPKAEGEIKLESKVGIYLQGAAKLYGVAGPKIAVGPYFSSVAAMSGNLATQNVKGKLSMDIGLGGKIGAEVKIWKWELGSWESEFNIMNLNIIDKNFDLQEWLKEKNG